MKQSNRMRPVHPGEILQEELTEIGLSSQSLAKELGIAAELMGSILNGKTGVTANTALRLARFFGTTPQLWMNLQQTWDLRQAEITAGDEIVNCVRPRKLPPRDARAESAS